MKITDNESYKKWVASLGVNRDLTLFKLSQFTNLSFSTLRNMCYTQVASARTYKAINDAIERGDV